MPLMLMNRGSRRNKTYVNLCVVRRNAGPHGAGLSHIGTVDGCFRQCFIFLMTIIIITAVPNILFDLAE